MHSARHVILQAPYSDTFKIEADFQKDALFMPSTYLDFSKLHALGVFFPPGISLPIQEHSFQNSRSGNER